MYRGERANVARHLPLALAVAFLGILLAMTARADPADWSPVEIVVREPPFLQSSSFNRFDYVPTEGATRRWALCGAMAGMGFEFIDSVIVGIEAEAARQGASTRFLPSDSGDMATQRRNIETCLAEGADAVLFLAGGSHGLEGVLQAAAKKGVPVVNVGLGTNGAVTARVVPDDVAMGEAIGRFLSEIFPAGGEEGRVVWLPGPLDSEFGPGYDRGFRHAIGNAAIEIVGGGFTDLDPDTMAQTVSDAVAADEVTTVAGIGPLIVPVMEALVGRAEKPMLVSTSITRELVEALGRGDLAAALNTKPVVMGRIAADIAIRALEGRAYLKDVAPFIDVVDQASLASFDATEAFAPAR